MLTMTRFRLGKKIIQYVQGENIMTSRTITTAQCRQSEFRKPTKMPFTASALAIAVALPFTTAVPQQAQAQATALEEIVVTAQRREERSQDVPIAITAIGSELLGQGDVQQLSDIAKLTPGVRFDNAGASSQPTIRGVGSAVVVSGATSNVGIYLDGFAVTSPTTMDFDLVNVESVQVLKGPQGTLFGRNSTGGAILVTTPEPESEASGKFELSYGSDNTQRYGLYATGGVTDNVAVDLGLLLRKSDGYLDNTFSGSDKDGEYESSTARVGIKWESDSSSLLFRYAWDDRDDRRNLAANAFADANGIQATANIYLPGSAEAEPHKVSNDYPPLFLATSDTFQLTYRRDLGDMAFTSLTQYRKDETSSMMDFDFSSLTVFHFNFDVNDEVFTQEFLLSSQSDNALQWTTGLYFFQNDNEFKNNASDTGGGFVLNGGSGTETTSAAAFADLTYQLANNWFLTGGLRVSYDEIDKAYFDTVDLQGMFTRNPVEGYDDTRVTPRVVLRYAPTDYSSLYASYNQGYKAGIINVGGGGQVGLDVEPEEIEAYEIGYKYSGESVSLDAAVYYYDYTDLQVAYYDGPKSIIENAGASRIYGADLQGRFAATNSLNINFGLAYVDAEYEEFDDSQVWNQCLDFQLCGVFFGIYSGGTTDASGFRMARTPEITGNLGFDYTTELAGGTLGLSGTYYYTSDFYFDSSELYEQDSYDLLSLRADWTNPSGAYTLSVYGDNLTDSEYRIQVLGQSFGGLSMWGAPATVGAGIRVNF